MGGLNYKVVKKTFGFDKDGTKSMWPKRSVVEP